MQASKTSYIQQTHVRWSWRSSKVRVFRIKSPSPCVGGRVAVCVAMALWYRLPSVAADFSEGRLHLRSRYGLEKSAVLSRLPCWFAIAYNPRSSLTKTTLILPLGNDFSVMVHVLQIRSGLLQSLHLESLTHGVFLSSRMALAGAV